MEQHAGNKFSDYLVFVDESGGPTLKEIDPDFPLLVLAFLIVKKSDYAETICPTLQKFKFRHFGHDQVILHEREIRRDLGAFAFLKSREKKALFLAEISDAIAAAPVQLACVVIRKDLLKQRYKYPANPYNLALEYGLERVDAFLRQAGAWNDAHTPITHVIVECRGRNEDNDLELQFRRICDGENYNGRKLNFELVFADKKSNSAGLQLADLVARPVGMSVIRPAQTNRAYEILRQKLVRRNGRIEGWGLKVFP